MAYVATSPGTASGGGAAQTGWSCSHPVNTNGSEKRPPRFAGSNVRTASPGRYSVADPRREIVDRRDPQDVRAVERNARRPCHRGQHVIRNRPRAFQVEVEPLEHAV